MLSMGISCKHGVCKSSRGILGFYPYHAPIILYYCGLRGLCALWKIPRKTPPNLPPTSRTPETNVVFTFRGVRIVRQRYAPRSRHDFAVKAKTNVCRVELRWTDQRRVAAPDGARPALRVRQQRHAAFAPSLRGHNNVIDAEVWRKTAWVKLLVQGRRDRTSPRKSMFMPCYTLCASTPCDSVGWA